MHQRYEEQAEFLAVYVREAHPGDGAWPGGFKNEEGTPINQPADTRQRVAVANQCSKKLEISMPLVVDEIDDRVGRAYSGMPDRLYIIDRGGRVAFKSGRGPFGFKPGEMEQALVMLLLDEPAKPGEVAAAAEERK